MKILALYSSKGGVGKSTASINLAYCASTIGKRTLLVDLDRVGSSSYCLQVTAKKSHGSEALLKGGKSFTKQIRPTDFPSLDVLPPSEAYSNLTLLLDQKKHAKDQLRKRFKEIAPTYDLIVVDTAPSLDLLAENVLLAADIILVPVIPTPLSLLGLNTVIEKAAALGVDTMRIKHFVSQFDRRKKMQLSIVGDLMQREGCLETLIPNSSAVERMGLLQDPVMISDKRSAGAKAYKALYQELSKFL